MALVPKWEDSQDCPPLAPRQAELAAQKALLKLMPEISNWKTEKISIRRAGYPSNWIYIVELTTLFPQGEVRGKHEEMEIVVLMNGIVINPEKD